MVRSTELANALLAAVTIAIQISIFCGPLFLGARLFALFSLIVLLFALATPTDWGLVHEGIHGRLWGRPFRNCLASRIMAVLLGFSFDLVQFGHLMHHRYNGHEFDRPDRIKTFEPLWKSLLGHYSHLLGGHYIMTAAAGILAGSNVERCVLRSRAGDGGYSESGRKVVFESRQNSTHPSRFRDQPSNPGNRFHGVRSMVACPIFSAGRPRAYLLRAGQPSPLW
jgi:fatty acid desaturase